MSKFISISIILVSILRGGLGDDRLTLIIEGSGGLFRPAPKNFTKIYENDGAMKMALLGVGYRNVYLVGRYRLFEAAGKSIVTGIDLAGSATWHEEFISLGLRSYSGKLLYAEVAYVIGTVKESISTNKPEYTALNSTITVSNKRGVSTSLGINVPIALGFNLSGEVGYLFVRAKIPDRSKSGEIINLGVNLGGPVYSVGLSFFF